MRSMSQMGQTRKSDNAIATSDLPLRADITRTSREVRSVPIAVLSEGPYSPALDRLLLIRPT